MPNRFVVGQFYGGYRSIFHLNCMYVYFFLINKKINAFLKKLDLKKPYYISINKSMSLFVKKPKKIALLAMI